MQRDVIISYDELCEEVPIYAYRYWRMDALALNLTGPIAASPIYHPDWTPGLNRAYCKRGCQDMADCVCGYYAFVADHKKLNCVSSNYFDLTRGVSHCGRMPGTQTVVGCAALWRTHLLGDGRVRGAYAAPAALCFPKNTTDGHLLHIQKVAAKYGITVTDPEGLYTEAQRFVKEDLPHLDETLVSNQVTQAGTAVAV